MALQKWYKKGLRYMDTQGYKIIPCKDETEALEVRDLLKKDKRCAQAGYILNKENKEIYFVLSKERNKKA